MAREEVRVVTTDPETRDAVTTTYPKMSEVSDGYHTFAELYRYRMLLQAAWFNQLYALYQDHDTAIGPPVKSWRHADGELCFGKENYFVVVAQLPTGQISNHYKGEYWDLFKILEVPTAPVWDGHTPQEAADRIEGFLTTNG